MRRLTRFLTNTAGSTVEKFAVSAAVLTIAGYTSAHFLAKMSLTPGAADSARNERALQFGETRSQALAGLGSLDPVANGKVPKFNNVDTTPLATMTIRNGQPVILDPCTGKQK